MRLLLGTHFFIFYERKYYMKKLIFLLLTVTMLVTFAACDKHDDGKLGMASNEAEETFAEFEWPKSDIAKLIPVPESNIGRIEWEASDGFVIYVGETTKEDFDKYVDACQENGFTVDYYAGEDFYYGYNEDGFHLYLNYYENDTMFIRMDEPDESELESSHSSEQTDNITEPLDTPAKTPDTTNIPSDEKNDTEPLSTVTADQTDKITEPPTSTTEGADTSKVPDEETAAREGIRPEFKEALDSYEEFFDEYCAFMKKYSESDNSISMLADYVQYMAKYADAMSKLDSIDDGEMSDEELIYYTEVMTRINKKLSEIA